MGLSSLRLSHYDKSSNNDELRLNLDFLFEVRDKAALKMARYQQKMAKYHNQMVKLRRFYLNDLVLRKVSQATRDPTQGKLGPTWEDPYKVFHYSRRGSYYLKDLDDNLLPRPWNMEHLKKYYQQEVLESISSVHRSTSPDDALDKRDFIFFPLRIFPFNLLVWSSYF